MELSGKWLECWYIFFVCQLCNGHPINLEDTLTDQHMQLLTGLVGVLLTICSLVFLVGCLCCQRRNNFKEFQNTPVGVSVQSDLDHGHINPIANGEFTIFTPLSPPLFNNNVFLPREQFITNKLESYVHDGTDLSSWFSESEEDFPRVKLKYIREVGKGKFGKIVEGAAQDVTSNNGEWTPTIVRILDSGSSYEEKLLFLKDAFIYKCSNHPNILTLYGKCLDTVPFLLLQEYCQDDLKFYLKSAKTEENNLNANLLLLWCTQLTSGLKHIHQHQLVHPDLAARNCRLTSDLQLKLGDYGLGPTKYPSDYYQTTSLLPIRWCDPESIIFKENGISLKQLATENNIWSLGVTLWEIFQCGEQPYSSLTDEDVIAQVLELNVRLEKPRFNSSHSDYVYHIIQSCWSPLGNRPSAGQLNIIFSDLLQIQEECLKHDIKADVYDEFDRKWESLKPNSVVKTNMSDSLSIETGESDQNVSKTLSASLNNLHGSLDDLIEKCKKRTAFSFENETIKREKCFNRSSSDSETEDENWRRGVERGAVTEKVRIKSRSVADLMVLTHVDYSESESETPFPSLDYRVNCRNVRNNLDNTHTFSSEGNLLNIEDAFERELRKLQEERRDSLLFVPDNISRNSSSLFKQPELLDSNVNNSIANSKLLRELSSPEKIQPQAQVFNVFNVTLECRSPLRESPTIDINNSKLKLWKSQEDFQDPEGDTNFKNYENKKSSNSIISEETTWCDTHNTKIDPIETYMIVENDNNPLNCCTKIESFDNDNSESEQELPYEPLIESSEKQNQNLLSENNEIQQNQQYNRLEELNFTKSNEFTEQNHENKIEEVLNLDPLEVVKDNSKSNQNTAPDLSITSKLTNEHSSESQIIFEEYLEKVLETDNISCADNISTTSSNDEKEINTQTENTNCDINLEKETCSTNNSNEPFPNENSAEKIVNFDVSSEQQKTRPNYLTHLTAFGSTPITNSAKFYSVRPLDDFLEKEANNFSSNFDPAETDESEERLIYSLETWDNFLDSTLNNQDYKNENMFDSFTSEPKSLLFINNSSETKEAYIGEKIARPDKSDEVSTVKSNATINSGLEVKEDFTAENNTTMNSTPNEEDDTIAANSATINEKENSIENNITMNTPPERLPYDTFTDDKVAGGWENSEGWFLSTQVNEDLTGDIQVSSTSDTYVNFGINDEIMSAIRNELLSKLPQAQGSNQERMREETDLDPQQSNEIYLKYIHNTPLSPIPEENASDESGSNTPKQKLEDEDDNSDWSEHEHRGEDTESPSPQILEGTSRGLLNRHTLSEDSCCSNDTLFNLEELNCATSELEKNTESPKENEDESNENNINNVTNEFLNQERKYEEDQLLFIKPPIQTAPLPSPENNPWKQLPVATLSGENLNKSNLPINNVEETIPNYVNVKIAESEPEYENCNQNEDDRNYNEYVNLENVRNRFEFNSDRDDYVNIPETNGASDDKMYGILTDIRFSGPSDGQLMSTSFSESNNCDEQEWDSGSDSRSSSSGEFIWKEGEHEESLKALRAVPQDVLENMKPMEKINEDLYEDTDTTTDEEGETPEFIPSAWDKFATPSKSALRSPEKTINKSGYKKAKVWFKKQKYHCIYEYPKEPESPVMTSQDLWKDRQNNTDSLGFWEYDDEYPVDHPDLGDINLANERNYYKSRRMDSGPSINRADEEFYISGSAQPFDIPSSSGSQFSAQPFDIPSSSGSQFSAQPFDIPSSSSCPFFPSSTNWNLECGDSVENATPDSGVEDMTSGSQTFAEFPKAIPTLRKLASDCLNKSKLNQNKTDDVLGGLRHTRSKLKLDLPPSPSAFSTDKIFTTENHDEPVVREKPSFTTFGKTRFQVQQIDTPKDENKRNVSFEALPYTPLVIKPKKESRIVEKNNDLNLKEETDVESDNIRSNIESVEADAEEKDVESDNIQSNIERVKGEASLLDSADEDSGIETSTLKRKFSDNDI